MTAAPATSRLERMALYVLLGFSAGLPFYMFSTVLGARLQRHGVGLVVIGFFGTVALLPTFKFAWAPLIDRLSVPGFARYWGRRRGWIMLAQLGIVSSLVALALVAADRSLALTALFATLLAFWTTTLEIAADGWRIELAPTQAEQGPVTAANLWGYRSAMVAAGSGSLIVADRAGWTAAYLLIAAAAFVPFPLLVAMRPEAGGIGRWRALGTGVAASAGILAVLAVIVALLGWLLLQVAMLLGIGATSNITPAVLALCMVPFLLMAVALPRIRRMGPEARARRSLVIGPYVEFFRRWDRTALLLLGFVSFYRMGDVLTLALSTLVRSSRGYSLTQIGVADGAVALAASMAGVAVGGWVAARWPLSRALALGAVASAVGNWIFVWLWHAPLGPAVIYIATGLDQFGHGLAGAVFVVYLSMLVDPRHAAPQYAFLSGFAFLLPRLLAVASGAIQVRIGYDGFFVLSGALSAAALLFLPFLARAKPRDD